MSENMTATEVEAAQKLLRAAWMALYEKITGKWLEPLLEELEEEK